MTPLNTHWSAQFPYLVPVWHSLAQRNTTHNTTNSYDPNLNIDIGGIGFYNGISHKKNTKLTYNITKPTLPFYLSATRTHCPHATRNCLAFSSKHNIMCSYNKNQFHILKLDINKHSSDYEANLTNLHLFSDNQRSNINPFIFNLNAIWNLKGNFSYIFIYFKIFFFNF